MLAGFLSRGGSTTQGCWCQPATLTPGTSSPPRSRSVPSMHLLSPAAPCSQVSWPGRWIHAQRSRWRSAGQWQRSWVHRHSWPAAGEAEHWGSRSGASCWGRRERNGGPAQTKRQEVQVHRLNSSWDNLSFPQTHCSPSSFSPREDGQVN